MPVAVVTGASSGIGAELVARSCGRADWHVGRALAPAVGRRTSTRNATSPTARRSTRRRARARAAPARSTCSSTTRASRRGEASSTRDPERIEQVIRSTTSARSGRRSRSCPGSARGSHVVNVVSVAGTVAVGPYSASKHAQLAFSRSLARRARAARHLGAHRQPRLRRDGGLPAARPVRPARLAPRRRPAARRRAAPRGGRRTTAARSRCPRWYRPAAWVQALAPGALARLRSRSRTNQPSSAS